MELRMRVCARGSANLTDGLVVNRRDWMVTLMMAVTVSDGDGGYVVGRKSNCRPRRISESGGHLNPDRWEIVWIVTERSTLGRCIQ